MKKLIFSFLLIALVVGACQNKKVEADSQQQEQMSTKQGLDSTITLTGSPDILTRATDTIKITMVNNTSLEGTTGEYYEIEKYVEESDITGWQIIPLELAFIDIAYILQPGDSKDFKILLHPENYKYEPGKYRVCKKASTEKGRYDLFFNFELKP